nr:uncharacterized protein LOC123766644 [Procambarus clarkii]
MARTYKVWIVIAVVLLTLNLVYSFSIYDLLFPRPRFPSRENVKKRLRMMLPLDESNTWNGYDDEGFTRNGRSLKHSNLGLDISQAMWPWPLDFAAERGRQM